MYIYFFVIYKKNDFFITFIHYTIISMNDKYTKEILKLRFYNFKNMYINENELINKGIKIRHQNTPEDITENITKFIIQKYEKDESCMWCKGFNC